MLQLPEFIESRGQYVGSLGSQFVVTEVENLQLRKAPETVSQCVGCLLSISNAAR